MPEPTDTDWAYAAGMVDGEGCIAIVRSFVPARDKFVYSVAVVVSNRDREALAWMHRLWKGWLVPARSSAANARPAWNWRSPTGTTAEPFLRGIRPWLRIKASQCDNALAMIEVLKRSRYTLGPKFLPPEWLRQQEEHYWIQRKLNHRGNEAFEAKPMHSPRQIHRERKLWAGKQSLSSP
jgi:hypothetical protein